MCLVGRGYIVASKLRARRAAAASEANRKIGWFSQAPAAIATFL